MIRFVEFLVEDASMEAALAVLLPKILPTEVAFNLHAHRGKSDLIKKTTGKLKGYRAWAGAEYLIVVIVDRDTDDCHELKRELIDAGLPPQHTKDTTTSPRFSYMVRIAIEELEAWFFGDWQAVSAAYPKVKPSVDRMRRFRDPDAITGTWEALESVLQQAGYFPAGMPKIGVAREIASNMNPARNTSASFRAFVDGLRDRLQAERD